MQIHKQQRRVTRIVRGAAATVMLAALLLVAQTIAFAHHVDLAAHANHQVCHVCPALGSLGAANVAVAPTLVPPQRSFFAPPAYTWRAVSARLIRTGSARSPPFPA